jgi:hypothetical protein
MTASHCLTRSVLATMALAGCASHTSSTSNTFELLVDSQPIHMVAPTHLIVELFVVGSPVDDVTITASNAPAFASISGTTIDLTPTLADAGDYAIGLVATSGSETATAELDLHITRMNTGPMWQPVPFFSNGSSSQPPYAQIRAPVCDLEHDNFTFEVSVAPLGATIPNTPDFTHFVDFAQTPPDSSTDTGSWCADFITEMPGLAPGSYHGAIHAVDVLGAEDPYGWVEMGMFQVSP